MEAPSNVVSVENISLAVGHGGYRTLKKASLRFSESKPTQEVFSLLYMQGNECHPQFTLKNKHFQTLEWEKFHTNFFRLKLLLFKSKFNTSTDT